MLRLSIIVKKMFDHFIGNHSRFSRINEYIAILNLIKVRDPIYSISKNAYSRMQLDLNNDANRYRFRSYFPS